MITLLDNIRMVVFEVGCWNKINYLPEEVTKMVESANDVIFPLQVDFKGPLVGTVDSLEYKDGKVYADVAILDKKRCVQSEIAPKLEYALTPISKQAVDVRIVSFGLVSDKVNKRWRIKF